MLAFSPLRLLAFVSICLHLFAFARICLRAALLRPPLRDAELTQRDSNGGLGLWEAGSLDLQIWGTPFLPHNVLKSL